MTTYHPYELFGFHPKNGPAGRLLQQSVTEDQQKMSRRPVVQDIVNK